MGATDGDLVGAAVMGAWVIGVIVAVGVGAPTGDDVGAAAA